MKQTVFILLFLLTSLVAQDEIKKVTTVETSNEFLLAQSHYNVGDYTKSYGSFKKLFLKYTDNEQVNYYLAMSAMQLKLYDDSTAAFERVLIVNPENHRARLEYARIQYLLGFTQEAKKEFLKVAQYPIPENVRANINKYLDLIDGKSNSSTFIALGFGYIYDDNINSGIGLSSFTLPGFYNLEVNADQPESSTAYLTSFQINHIHPLGKDTAFALQHTGTMFYKNQTENDKYNFSYYAYTPTLFYNDVANKSEYSLQLGVEKIQPGDRVDFTTYSMAPKYRYLLNKDTVLSAFVEYKEFHYDENIDKEKSYTKRLLGGSIKYDTFKYILSFDEDNKDSGTRTDINKNIMSSTFLYRYDIIPSLFLNLRYQHNQTRYNDEDVLFANTRKDFTNIYNIGLTKIINNKDFVSLSYTHTNNNSNQGAYTYDKEVVYLNYTWRFKL